MNSGMIVACSLSGLKINLYLPVSLVLNSFMCFKNKLDARKINLTYIAIGIFETHTQFHYDTFSKTYRNTFLSAFPL